MAEFIVIRFFQNPNIVFHEGKDHGQAGVVGAGAGGVAGTPFNAVFKVF